MPRHVVRGLGYHYDCQGSGPPLLLLHGFTGSHAGWAHLLAGPGECCRVIAVDLPGHGDSDSPPDLARYGLEQVSADLVALMEHCGHSRFNLLGYSMGGRLALALALAFPQRVAALVLESASPGLSGAAERARRREQDERLARQIETGGVRRFVQHWEQLPLFASQRRLPASIRRDLRDRRMGNRAEGLAASLRGAGTGAQPSFWSSLPRLGMPALLLCGALDPKFTDIGRRMKEANPAMHLSIVPDAGHCIHLERPQAYERAVLEFLSRQEA